MISAIATGATEAYLYVRAEYPNAVARLRNAIRQAEEAASRSFSAQLEEGLAALKEIGND